MLCRCSIEQEFHNHLLLRYLYPDIKFCKDICEFSLYHRKQLLIMKFSRKSIYFIFAMTLGPLLATSSPVVTKVHAVENEANSIPSRQILERMPPQSKRPKASAKPPQAAVAPTQKKLSELPNLWAQWKGGAASSKT
jgi:hypothetical protein